jgi:hypothetical protein
MTDSRLSGPATKYPSTPMLELHRPEESSERMTRMKLVRKLGIQIKLF